MRNLKAVGERSIVDRILDGLKPCGVISSPEAVWHASNHALVLRQMGREEGYVPHYAVSKKMRVRDFFPDENEVVGWFGDMDSLLERRIATLFPTVDSWLVAGAASYLSAYNPVDDEIMKRAGSSDYKASDNYRAFEAGAKKLFHGLRLMRSPPKPGFGNPFEANRFERPEVAAILGLLFGYPVEKIRSFLQTNYVLNSADASQSGSMQIE